MQKERRLKEVNIFQRVGSYIGNTVSSLFRRGRTYLMNIGVKEVLPDINAEKAVTEGYSANSTVYTIIDIDAEKFASIPRYVVDAKSVEEKQAKLPHNLKRLINGIRVKANTESIKPDLTKLLNRPNPYQGQAAFYKTVRSYFKACGEGFIWLNRGDVDGLTDAQIALKPVLEMYPLPSYRMEAIPDPDNFWGVSGWLLDVGGEKIPFKKVEIIHWKGTNLTFDAYTKEHLRGMPALKPGAADLQQNNDATRSSIRMHQNDGAKGALYEKTGVKMTPAQETQIRGVIDRKINNNDVKGAVAALQGEWGYLDLGKTSIDLDLLNAKKVSIMQLCFLFRVPYTFFDPNTAWANSEWQQKNWVSNSIVPASKELDDELNRVLPRAFGVEGKQIIQCDFTELPEMQQDMKLLTEWLKEAWWITPNEKRELQGYEKLTEELMDEPWVPQGLAPLSQSSDDFEKMINSLGVQGANDYEKKPPAKTNGQLNGAKTN
jgi:HK97 family phage portal protein